MTTEQIGDADRHACAPAAASDDRGRHPGIHGISRRVGNADHGIAIAVGAMSEPLAQFRRVGPEEETYLHVAVPASVSACAARVRVPPRPPAYRFPAAAFPVSPAGTARREVRGCRTCR